jgi:hypothetical protein
MDFFIQFIREFILVIPGAFLRWLYFGKKQPFSIYLNKNSIYDYLLSFIIIIIFSLLIVFLT